MKGDQDNPWSLQGYRARRLGPSLWSGPEAFDPSTIDASHNGSASARLAGSLALCSRRRQPMTAPKPWLKLWTEIRTDIEMRCIDPASRWAFVGVLCLAQELGQNGLLLLNGKPLSDAAIADAIGVDLAMWHEVLAYFLDTGSFHIDPSGALCVTNFAKRQADTLGKRPHKSRWEVIRNAVFQRDDFTCRYCGERAERPECDHIVPVSRGGSNTLDNLATSCQRCNRSKRDKTPSEWRSEYELV